MAGRVQEWRTVPATATARVQLDGGAPVMFPPGIAMGSASGNRTRGMPGLLRRRYWWDCSGLTVAELAATVFVGAIEIGGAGGASSSDVPAD